MWRSTINLWSNAPLDFAWIPIKRSIQFRLEKLILFSNFRGIRWLAG